MDEVTMDAATYQREAARTLIDAPPQPLTDLEHMIVWNILGLMGEAGEVFYLMPGDPEAQKLLWRASQLAEHCKKAVFHEQGWNYPLVHSLLDRIGLAAATFWAELPDPRTGAEINRPLICKELGDVCWYLAALATKFGWPLTDILRDREAHMLADVFAANIAKLKTRFPRGWDVTDAAARVDVAEVAP